MPTSDERLEAIEKQLDDIKHALGMLYEAVAVLRQQTKDAYLDNLEIRAALQKIPQAPHPPSHQERKTSDASPRSPDEEMQAILLPLRQLLEKNLRPQKKTNKH